MEQDRVVMCYSRLNAPDTDAQRAIRTLLRASARFAAFRGRALLYRFAPFRRRAMMRAKPGGARHVVVTCGAVTMFALNTGRLPCFAANALRGFAVAWVAATGFVSSNASHAQTGQGTGTTSGIPPGVQQNPEPVNPQTLSCNALKARLRSSGQMTVLAGPRGGWGDTFYGPAVPRCQFWQMPEFTYVRASDGLCGVGYICVDKMSRD